MSHHIESISDDFWNIRGSFRVLGLLDVQTQCSLIRLRSGGYAMLDSYTLEGDVRERVLARTDAGRAVEAVINLHPFHTMHIDAMRPLFPEAKHYGTARHHERFSSFPWEPQRTEDPDFAALFEDDLELWVPDGAQLVTDSDRVHFGSVLAIHAATQTLHVDDTLSWLPLPLGGLLHWHPTLRRALNPSPEAADAFRQWAERLAQRCEKVRNVCTAHARGSSLRAEEPGEVAGRIRAATKRVEWVLGLHERS